LHDMDVEGDRGTCMMTIREKIMSLFQPSDNKLAMKLFGNRNAVMKERLRQRAANIWVIHPCSDFRYVIYQSIGKRFSVNRFIRLENYNNNNSSNITQLITEN